MPLPVGPRLGPYEIKSPLGSGGMGEVYLARDTRLERDVAVKVLPTSFAPGSEQLAQFEREARLLASLNHQNICAIYDVGSDRGISFIVMEQLQGETLADRIARGPVSSHVALRYAIQIADALKAAHSAGLVHRDVKPGNIMLTTTGVKLLDFGVAKRHEPAAGSTRMVDTPGRKEGPVGTLFYMAPEQLAGGDVDHRADIWSFGCVLYEMLTGRRAFAGKTMTDVIAAIVKEAPVVMNVERGVVPLALQQVVARCLARDPSQRWQTVDEFARELVSMLPHAPAPGVPPAQPPSTSGTSTALPVVPEEAKVPGRRRGAWIAAAAATIALSAAAAGFLIGRGDAPRPTDAIAVLPFANAAGGADAGYLSEGLAEGVLAELARVAGITTIAAGASFRAGLPPDPREAGRLLGASRVMKGQVGARGGRVEVEAELIDVATGSAVWTGHYSEPPSEILTLQRTLIEGVLKALRLPSAGNPGLSTLPSTLNPEAYRLILRGRHALRRPTDRALKNAIGFFTEASTSDPRAAAAYAGLASAYVALAQPGVAGMTPRDAFAGAKRAALRAIELDAQCGEAYLALGTALMVGDWDWRGAGAAFDRAVELAPDDPIAHQRRALWLMDTGRSDNAVTEAQTAIDLDPRSPSASRDLGWLLYLARRYADSIEQLKVAVALDPDAAEPRWALGMAYERSGRFDQALEELETASRLSGARPLYLSGVGYVHARAGRAREATQVLERLRPAAAGVDLSSYDMALVSVGLDDRAAAFRWLEQAVENHAPSVTSLAVDPRLDPLRSDSRFKDLLKRLGL